MQENYINIFSSFLASEALNKNISNLQIYKLLGDFIPVCETIKNRQGLLNFIEPRITAHPVLKKLKTQLLDQQFNFTFNPPKTL